MLAEPLPTALLLTTFGTLLAIAVFFSRATERVSVPVVLIFLITGMLAGSEGVGGIAFENYAFAVRLGTIALVLILFDGGLNTSLAVFKKVAAPAGVLATIGVIMMAGLVAIPKDLQEQAEVDGSGYWRRMFEITIPLMMPLIAVAALFGAIVTFTDMTVVYVLTRGGPTNSTQVLASWAFFRGIEGGDIAQGAAVALFLFPLLLAAAILILRAVRRMDVM